MIEAWTDGCCLVNPGGAGGWAAVIRDRDHQYDVSGGESESTNNRMELEAVIQALNAIDPANEVTIWSDSRYVVDGATRWIGKWKKNGWKTKQKADVKNQGHWRRLDAALAAHGRVRFRWLRGHSDHPENDQADALAMEAALRFT